MTDEFALSLTDRLKEFDPITQDWDELGRILDSIPGTQAPQATLPALLEVFERWPGAMTGGGWLYPSLHLVEEFDQNSECTLRSFRRAPSIFTVMLLERAIRGCNSKRKRATMLMELKRVLGREDASRSVKREIENVLATLPSVDQP